MKEFIERIKNIHTDCHMLINQSVGRFLPVAGNLGVFCQSEEEYDHFLVLSEEITFPSSNPNQKYFELKEPIGIQAKDDIPGAAYTHLYIRKPDPSPYGRYFGDIDFVMVSDEYKGFKELVNKDEIIGTEMYDRPGWDTIQITNPDINSVAYVSTKDFAEKVRVKFD